MDTMGRYLPMVRQTLERHSQCLVGPIPFSRLLITVLSPGYDVKLHPGVPLSKDSPPNSPPARVTVKPW